MKMMAFSGRHIVVDVDRVVVVVCVVGVFVIVVVRGSDWCMHL